MAISKFHASTIVEVRAYFGFGGFECDPSEISRALRIEPDEILQKGSKRLLRNGHEMEVGRNSWSIESQSISKDINEHLRELLRRLVGSEILIQPHFGKPAFSVLWKGNYLYAGSGPFYESDVLKGIACFDAELYHDIYQIDQSEDDIENESEFKRIPKC